MRFKPAISCYILALALTLAPVFSFSFTAKADPLLSRSVRIGDSRTSVTTSHNYTFTISSAGTIGSIEFEYCDNTPFVGTSCGPPSGLNVAGATIASQTGATGFSVHGSTSSNRLVISRAPSANLAFQLATYNFNNIVNPDSNSSTYVRISTFASNDATGARTDEGAVVFSTVSNLQVEGYVPPYLTFCTGITVALDCSSANGDFIQLGELSKTSPNTATSQFSGATNDPGGFSTSVSGTTMTSGSNIIPALSGNTSSPGNSQFGINLRANTNPGVGQNPTGSGTSVARPGYNAPNSFRFANEVITNSPISTNFRRFTVSYLVNASSNQPAGVYSATLTYVAVAAF
jgi:hypothetical protein